MYSASWSFLTTFSPYSYLSSLSQIPFLISKKHTSLLSIISPWFCFLNYFYFGFFISETTQYFFIWFISLKTVFSRCAHFPTNNSHLFLFMAGIYNIFLIYSSVDGHLNCFYNLAIVISTAINLDIRISL